jgi:3-methyladenine DNA glycosylase AlkC
MKIPKNIDNLKIPQLKKLVQQILKKEKNKKEIKKLGICLVNQGGWGKTFVGVHLLAAVKDVVKKNEFKKVIYKLADDERWDVRETAASLIKQLLLLDFDYYFEIMKEMVKHKNANIRRAAVVGSMQTKLIKSQARQIAKHIYEPLMADDDVYVRKNLGPFAIGDFLLRLYPDLTVEFFDKWLKTKHPRIIWNVLNAFQLSRLKNGKYGSRLKEAKKYLKIAEKIEDKTVERAVKSLKRKIEKIS